MTKSNTSNPSQLVGIPTIEHNPALDGIRGLAVIGVILHHFVPRTGMGKEGWLGQVIEAACRVGANGVELFFVLSGFLITGILLDTRQSSSFFRTFYARRSLRIFPLYYLALVAAFVLAPIVRGSPGETTADRYQIYFWLYGSNFLSAYSNEFLTTYDFALNHFWSLAIEEQFYLAWPLVIYLCRTPKRAFAVAVALCTISVILRIVSLRYFSPRTCYMLTWCRLEPLAAGAMLAAASRLGVDRVRLCSKLRLPGLLSLAALVVMECYRDIPLPRRDFLIAVAKYPIAAIASAWLVSMAVNSKDNRVLCWSVFGWLGRRSYGLYVYHGMLRLYFSWLAAYLNSILPHSVSIPVTLFLGIGFVVIISEISFQLFEKKINNLKKHFPYKT